MSDPFLQQLADLVQSQPTANKWVLVPHHELGWMLGERLLLQGCNWINLRFVTPFQLALEAAAPDLLAQGLNPCPEGLGPSLMHHLILQLADHPFAELIDQPGTAEALWRTLCECRLAGVSLGDLDSAYQAYLDENQLVDRSQVYRSQAPTKVDASDVVVLYPYHIWPPLVRTFVDGLPGRHLAGAATDLPAPRRLTGKRQPVAIGSSAEISFFSAGRRDLEFQEVLRRIDRPYDQVELVAHREDLPLLADMLVQFDCPATFSQGLPMGLSRPGQALLGFINWLQQGLPGFLLRELLMANLLKAPPNSWTSARLVKAARIGWGKADYAPRLEALAQRSLGHEKLQIQAGQTRELAGWLEALFAQFPENPSGTVPLQVWLGSLQGVVEQHLDHQPEATPVLLAALEEMKRLPGRDWPRTQLLHLVRERVVQLRWSSRRPTPGHLHVTSIDQLGLSGRPVVFITGQEEGRDVNLPVEDCVLSDQARTRLHPDLALSGDVLEEHHFMVAERLTTMEGQLTYSYSLRDRQGEQELLPSWRFFEAARRVRPELTSYSQLLDWLGEPAQPWQAEESEDYAGNCQTVLRDYPDLASGLEADRQRASPDFTVYDGWVPSAAGLWDPRNQQQAVSVSRLQSLAACPYSYFLSQGLGLFPEPLPLPDPDSWLDAAARGHVLHQIFAEYGQSRREGQEFDFLPALNKALAHQLPPPSRWVENLERDTLEQHFRHFLALEATRPEHVPVGLEVGFGLGQETEPLGQPQPVTLDLDEGMVFRLQGRIDRLDKAPDGYWVVDYKTGRQFGEAHKGLYDKGKHLQHGLYALAAAQLLKQDGVKSGYYFTHPQAARPWQYFPPTELQPLREVLDQVLRPLVDGTFVPTHQSANDCRYCSYQAACFSHQDSQVGGKLLHPRLAARRQLLEQV